MAIQDLLRTLGQRVNTGFQRMGATTDPRLSPEAQRLAGIQNLSQALRRTGATLSGDPQRMALQAQEDERLRQRRLRESFLRDYPEYGEILRATESGVPASMFASAEPTKKPTSYLEYELTDKTPTNEEYLQFLRNKQAATQIDPFMQEAAKAGFTTKKQIDEGIANNQELLDRVRISKKLLEAGAKTGTLEEFLQPFRRFAISLGFADEETIKNFGQQELFSAVTDYLVPRMRVAGSGSTSDREIELFKSTVPNLGRTPEGNLVIAGGLEALFDYNKKRGILADKYLRENKSLLGFGEYADQELGSFYESYSSDQEFDTKVRDGKLKAGDFVFDNINGQFRVLTKEDVRIN
tara:strand:+ start:8 stop:1063 length:1056 start_codon:yes stop_codon:yes gene_type:complete